MGAAMFHPDDLIVQRPEGLYCPPGNFYIDPWRPVDRAVITHAHADHARRGHGHYLAAQDCEGLLRARLGQVSLQCLAYGQAIVHHGVRLSLHPAGHVLGSAQVRLEHAGRIWVASGDYKVAADRTCTAFEPVRCDVFITESTFGLPIYRWRSDEALFADMNAWWAANCSAGSMSALPPFLFTRPWTRSIRCIAMRACSCQPPSPGRPGLVWPLLRATAFQAPCCCVRPTP